ncbi:unnamed protein product [Acanthosepion pharaonis]|uniref:Uncharacterized protein n=1 Tax=Acanthosepion pharaonis TaxID=158019 RepID=A0A812CQW1_ACAPH|nr:unnamed protein product [Sepia pharaonis]
MVCWILMTQVTSSCLSVLTRGALLSPELLLSISDLLLFVAMIFIMNRFSLSFFFSLTFLFIFCSLSLRLLSFFLSFFLFSFLFHYFSLLLSPSLLFSATLVHSLFTFLRLLLFSSTSSYIFFLPHLAPTLLQFFHFHPFVYFIFNVFLPPHLFCSTFYIFLHLFILPYLSSISLHFFILSPFCFYLINTILLFSHTSFLFFFTFLHLLSFFHTFLLFSSTCFSLHLLFPPLISFIFPYLSPSLLHLFHFPMFFFHYFFPSYLLLFLLPTPITSIFIHFFNSIFILLFFFIPAIFLSLLFSFTFSSIFLHFYFPPLHPFIILSSLLFLLITLSLSPHLNLLILSFSPIFFFCFFFHSTLFSFFFSTFLIFTCPLLRVTEWSTWREVGDETEMCNCFLDNSTSILYRFLSVLLRSLSCWPRDASFQNVGYVLVKQVSIRLSFFQSECCFSRNSSHSLTHYSSKIFFYFFFSRQILIRRRIIFLSLFPFLPVVTFFEQFLFLSLLLPFSLLLLFAFFLFWSLPLLIFFFFSFTFYLSISIFFFFFILFSLSLIHIFLIRDLNLSFLSLIFCLSFHNLSFSFLSFLPFFRFFNTFSHLSYSRCLINRHPLHLRKLFILSLHWFIFSSLKIFVYPLNPYLKPSTYIPSLFTLLFLSSLYISFPLSLFPSPFLIMHRHKYFSSLSLSL